MVRPDAGRNELGGVPRNFIRPTGVKSLVGGGFKGHIEVSLWYVRVAKHSAEPATGVVLNELRLGELCAIAVPVKCKRSDMPPKGSLLAEMEKYL